MTCLVPKGPNLTASTLKSHVHRAPRWTLPLPQGAQSVPGDASTARGTVGTPGHPSPTTTTPPGLRGVGRLWSASASLGWQYKGMGKLEEGAPCWSTCTDPLLLLPPLQGLVVAVLYCFLNGEVSVLRLPGWRSPLAPRFLLRSPLERVVGRHGWCGWEAWVS